MKIGKLRTRVQFQRRTLVQDPSTGSSQPTWVTYENCMADVRGIRGQENLDGTNKLNAIVTHRVYARAHSGFEPKQEDRILQGSKVIEITSVVDIEERDFWFEILGFEDLNQ